MPSNRGAAVNSAKLIDAHTRLGLHQKGLSELARIDVKTVRKAERGQRIDIAPLTRLAYALNVDLRELVRPDLDDDGWDVRGRDLILKWNRLWEAHDLEGVLALYHDDAVFSIPGAENLPFSGSHRGKEQLRKLHVDTWATMRYEPIRAEELEIFVSKDAVTMQGAKGVYLPSGELVYVPTVHVFLFKDDLIIDHSVAYDTLKFAKQFNGEASA
ncbi:MAG: nuclear transport factor 2 family protein [Pirellulales bacterium]